MTNEFFEKLLDVSRRMAETRLPAPLMAYAMQVALEMFNAEYGYLMLLDPGGQLDFRVSLNRLGETLPAPDDQISHTIFETVIQERKPLLTADAIVDPALEKAQSVIGLRLRSVMCVPLVAHERVLGAIYLENRTLSGVFTQRDVPFLEYFAAQTAISLENAMLNQDLQNLVEQRTAELRKALAELQKSADDMKETNQRLEEEITKRKEVEDNLRHLALTDPLTGIYNRRQFFVLAEQTISNARRYHRPVSALMLDTDHFKNINDHYGHKSGDLALQALAALLRNAIRQADILCRYGGEEFAILMPETQLNEAALVAERIRKAVDEHVVEAPAGAVHITVSIGVSAVSPTGEKSLDDLLVRADQALYRAKQLGRNRVALAE